MFLIMAVVSLIDFVDNYILKGVCFLLFSKVQSNLTVICSESMKEGLWCGVNYLVVDFLLPYQSPYLQIKHPYEV